MVAVCVIAQNGVGAGGVDQSQILQERYIANGVVENPRNVLQLFLNCGIVRIIHIIRVIVVCDQSDCVSSGQRSSFE